MCFIVKSELLVQTPLIQTILLNEYDLLQQTRKSSECDRFRKHTSVNVPAASSPIARHASRLPENLYRRTKTTRVSIITRYP